MNKLLQVKYERKMFRMLQSILTCTMLTCTTCCLKCDKFFDCFYSYNTHCQIFKNEWVCHMAINKMSCLAKVNVEV